jgi:hypothetical protein
VRTLDEIIELVKTKTFYTSQKPMEVLITEIQRLRIKEEQLAAVKTNEEFLRQQLAARDAECERLKQQEETYLTIIEQWETDYDNLNKIAGG